MMEYRWQIEERLPVDQEATPLRHLLQRQWLLPKRLVHYLRSRRQVLVNGSYRPYLQWRESNTWEHEVWYWWVPLASAADRMLAEKFRNHLSELHSRGDCRNIQRMTAEIKWFTIPEVNLMAETGDSQNWYPRYSHSDMNDNIRLRLNKAIETTDSKEFVDIAYKMGLFLPEGEDD